MKSFASGLLAGLSLMFFSTVGVAQTPPYYNCCGGQPIRWNTPSYNVTIRFSLDISSPWRAPFAAAVRSWNDLVGSEWDLTLDSVAGNPTVGVNNAYFSSDPNLINALAMEFTKYDFCAPDTPCCRASPCGTSSIIETDIVFWVNDSSGNPWSWSSAIPANITTNTFGSTRYFAAVAAHELGHSAGLTDQVQQHARMNVAYPNGGWLHSAVSDTSSNYERLVPKSFDQTNIRAMYPQAGSGSRVYANNVQPQSGSSATQVLSYDPVANNQTFYPSPSIASFGNAVQIRICYGNAGNAAFSTAIPIKVYLSSNDKLDAGDTQAISGWSFPSGLPAGQYGCTNIDFVVPNVPTNLQYYVLYVLDIGVGTSPKQHQVINRKLTVL